jgi:hypothetical protein
MIAYIIFIKQFKDIVLYLFVLGDRAAKVSFIFLYFMLTIIIFYLGIFALLAQLDRAQDF